MWLIILILTVCVEKASIRQRFSPDSFDSFAVAFLQIGSILIIDRMKVLCESLRLLQRDLNNQLRNSEQ